MFKILGESKCIFCARQGLQRLLITVSYLGLRVSGPAPGSVSDASCKILLTKQPVFLLIAVFYTVKRIV